jgi:hypothetical protein
MLGQQTQPMELRYHRLEVSYRWILAVALIALIALAALVGWTAIDRLGQPNGEDVGQSLTAAWSTATPRCWIPSRRDAVWSLRAAQRARAGRDQVPTCWGPQFVEIIGPVVQTAGPWCAHPHDTVDGDVYYVTTILDLNRSRRSPRGLRHAVGRPPGRVCNRRTRSKMLLASDPRRRSSRWCRIRWADQHRGGHASDSSAGDLAPRPTRPGRRSAGDSGRGQAPRREM